MSQEPIPAPSMPAPTRHRLCDPEESLIRQAYPEEKLVNICEVFGTVLGTKQEVCVRKIKQLFSLVQTLFFQFLFYKPLHLTVVAVKGNFISLLKIEKHVIQRK